MLIAPLDAPGKRHLLVSKVDESIVVDGVEHILYTNMCRKNITEGYKNQTSFEKDEVPTKWDKANGSNETIIEASVSENGTYYSLSQCQPKVRLQAAEKPKVRIISYSLYLLPDFMCRFQNFT